MADFQCVWNPTEEPVSTVINGSHFHWNPGQFKTMREMQARFVSSNRQETGLVVLDDLRFAAGNDEFIPGFEKTEEAKPLLSKKQEEGVANLIHHLMGMIRNNQVSLRQDLAHKYPTADAAKLAAINASPAELNAMRLVAKYKKKNGDNDAKRVDEVEKLMKDIGPFTS